MDPNRFKVTVKDGVVTIDGEPETAEVGREMIDAIRHIEGVVAVRDRLAYPAPNRCIPSVRSSELRTWLEISVTTTSGTVPHGAYALLTDGTAAEIARRP